MEQLANVTPVLCQCQDFGLGGAEPKRAPSVVGLEAPNAAGCCSYDQTTHHLMCDGVLASFTASAAEHRSIRLANEYADVWAKPPTCMWLSVLSIR